LKDFEKDPTSLARDLLARPEDGRIKMLLTALSLRFRRANQALFRQGAYEACEVEGPRASQAVAFARTGSGKAAIAVAGRFFARFGGAPPTGEAWRETRLTLPEDLRGAEYREVFTNRPLSSGGQLDLEEVFAVLPVALVEVRSLRA
jgi:(1->4)-alpha-D-glucan 1-alpha-D-glucosylmutase